MDNVCKGILEQAQEYSPNCNFGEPIPVELRPYDEVQKEAKSKNPVGGYFDSTKGIVIALKEDNSLGKIQNGDLYEYILGHEGEHGFQAKCLNESQGHSTPKNKLTSTLGKIFNVKSGTGIGEICLKLNKDVSFGKEFYPEGSVTCNSGSNETGADLLALQIANQGYGEGNGYGAIDLHKGLVDGTIGLSASPLTMEQLSEIWTISYASGNFWTTLSQNLTNYGYSKDTTSKVFDFVLQHTYSSIPERLQNLDQVSGFYGFNIGSPKAEMIDYVIDDPLNPGQIYQTQIDPITGKATYKSTVCPNVNWTGYETMEKLIETTGANLRLDQIEITQKTIGALCDEYNTIFK
jgi:hypothetical protein